MSANIFGSASFKPHGVDKKYVDSKFISLTKTLQTKLDKTLTEVLNINGHRVCYMLDPINATDATNKSYVDSELSKVSRLVNSKLALEGDTMLGNINMDGYKIIKVLAPVNDSDVANKNYVDAKFDLASRVGDNFQNLYMLNTVGLVPHLSSSNDETG